ncbi:hypothetical protein AC625_06865 [Peribacillus loiseleuriae]|uniref:Aminotransferase class I/classII domain-containing protein n=1 Tax=Peribacillus loiseleuriae TaxID=1679170 RepID=A0A0K9GRL5_9BACI|nr:hypothetical protein AC625_06865 [Peribacillus loiseleuriae]
MIYLRLFEHAQQGDYLQYIFLYRYYTSLSFCLELVEKTKVAVIPRDAFSQLGEGYFRFSYACSLDILKEALNRIE